MAALVKGTRQTVIPTQLVAPGTYESPTYDVPANVSTVELTIDRNAWPAGVEVARVGVWKSADAGATWGELTTISMSGGAAPRGPANSRVVAAAKPGWLLKAKAQVFADLTTRVELFVN